MYYQYDGNEKKISANFKAKNVSYEKNYHPVKCSKISNKLPAELVGMCTNNQAIDNDQWDCGQLRAVEGVLNTVDLLIKIVPGMGTKVFSH